MKLKRSFLNRNSWDFFAPCLVFFLLTPKRLSIKSKLATYSSSSTRSLRDDSSTATEAPMASDFSKMRLLRLRLRLRLPMRYETWLQMTMPPHQIHWRCHICPTDIGSSQPNTPKFLLSWTCRKIYFLSKSSSDNFGLNFAILSFSLNTFWTHGSWLQWIPD